MRICIESLSESIYACPPVRLSVRLSMLNCKQSTGRIYDPNWMKFGTAHFLAQGRTLLKLGKIGPDLDIAPIYIFVRFIYQSP